ncbi:YlbE-like family protein [Metabacillus fastidiosus]|uniref:YlbE-like family protein n=1 Tax=Metabacillus fastidiosus TaxID=1458 RepID=A0ABU6NX48_9BACI|nr:YlbE-like family protein [Metabacillus fastidiosus]MED4401697.1 YlbE-like family protein [Metabacillus fastidiosus]MED4452743.1 YlbE-like family protein [Metabacillus fastidiosus]MED4463336.1 YlbE-like family protein [Metabacillus fastidiosus]
MRKDVIEYIKANKDLKRFLREQPYWYRRLARNPKDIEKMKIEMMNYYQKTIPHKVAQFSNSVQMAQMMLGMFQAMKQQD